jgi:polyphosphate kinase 2 (PPK2 family)
LPPKGHLGLFLSCWYSRPILDHVYERSATADFDRELDRIAAFEKMLADDGTLILKFWMHLGRNAQKRRLKSLEKDPLQSWRVSKQDWKNWKLYDRFIATAEHTVRRTDTGQSRWVIVEGQDMRYRSLTVLTSLLETTRDHLRDREAQRKIREEVRSVNEAQRASEMADVRSARASLTKEAEAETKTPPTRRKSTVTVSAQGRLKSLTVLDSLDMTQAVSSEEYAVGIKQARADLAVLYRQAKEQQVSTLLVFEGVDAAGKGGAIRRLTPALDARDYRVIPIAAPTDEERAQHYLWRFWRHLPRAGRVTIFDRSWYGRVLVERVEGFATVDEWMRAFSEINDFEDQLVRHGTVLIKFWLHITKEEQYLRFKQRQEIAYKRWKLTDEDWRNRSKWDQYELAVNEMVERTSTADCPWVLVEGNDKNFARLKIIRTVCNRLRRQLS